MEEYLNPKIIFKLLIFLFVSINVSCSDSKHDAPLFNNIGNFEHPISTHSPLAQRYFNQGLSLLYSFEYAEAIRSFTAATKIDPTCAMCYWGLALSLGSKTNTPLNGRELKDAQTAIELAAKYVKNDNLTEKLYISALVPRYKNLSPQILNEMSGLCGVSSISNDAAKNYLNSMLHLMSILPNDPDVKTLYVAAFVDSVKWMFWQQDGKPYPQTMNAIKTLDEAIKINKNHPGANHFYIHIVEGSPFKAEALPSAIRLAALVPVSEHMAHMPCHTYYSLGQYHQAVLVNQVAIQRYKDYEKVCKAQGFEPEPQFLYFHNYDFLVSAASMEGHEKLSIDTAKVLAMLVMPYLEKTPFLQLLTTRYILMLARFGHWQSILDMKAPSSKYQYALAIWHYARGMAFLQTKQINFATDELKQLQAIHQRGPSISNLDQYGFTLLTIANNILSATLDMQNHHYESMIVKLKEAIKLQDSIYYSDPPGWYFPIRQMLGYYLMKIGKMNDAKDILREDLVMNPNNGWSLYILSQCEKVQGNSKEAERLNNEFKQSWKYADIKNPIFISSL